MQIIYRCPNCTKASYEYGLCSEKCKKEYLKNIEEDEGRLRKFFRN